MTIFVQNFRPFGVLDPHVVVTSALEHLRQVVLEAKPTSCADSEQCFDAKFFFQQISTKKKAEGIVREKLFQS